MIEKRADPKKRKIDCKLEHTRRQMPNSKTINIIFNANVIAGICM